MPFILSEQREHDGFAASRRYKDYVESNRDRFPASAFALATSDWYFSFGDPRAPHDAHLVSVTISETPLADPEPFAGIAIRIRIRSAHKGIIELFYPRVYRYSLTCSGSESCHCDWRYDEFRLSDEGHLLHEIEWWHGTETARWLIEASDVEHRWHEAENG